MVQYDLEGKVALVTGASHGIGFAMARALGEAGASVAFCCRTEERRDAAVAQYKECGLDVKGYVCDVTDEDQVSTMISAIENDLGGVDILVNNAAVIKRVPMHEMDAADFRKIINLCSMMSEFGRETVSAYASAKGGIKMLTRNIASEYGQYNIQCNGIGPGYIATAQTAPLIERLPDGSRNPFDQFIMSKTPADRWGTPEDLMGPTLFLASSASDFVNGHILYVDGGIVAYLGRQPK